MLRFSTQIKIDICLGNCKKFINEFIILNDITPSQIPYIYNDIYFQTDTLSKHIHSNEFYQGLYQCLEPVLNNSEYIRHMYKEMGVKQSFKSQIIGDSKLSYINSLIYHLISHYYNPYKSFKHWKYYVS